MRRKLKITVISDVHLGTYGCHARELLNYLKSIQPEILVLNGDIVDAWQFKKRFFPVLHLNVIREILKLSSKGTTVYYITGNHDDVLRQLSDFSMGKLHLVDKLEINVNGKRHWFFHGDVFDASMQLSPWLAKLGGKGYDILIRINRIINKTRDRFGKPPMSFSKKVKSGVKKAVKYIGDFENIAINLAVENNYDVVVCGHIHHAQKRNVVTKSGNVLYLNSGDWVESLTALEFDNTGWNIYYYLDHHKLIHDEELNSITDPASDHLVTTP